MADRRMLAAAAAVLLLGGCSGSTPSEGGPGERNPTVSAPAVRTDPEPLAKRFPKLGDFTEAHWQGSAAGEDSGGVPGPTDVRILAVVELAAADRTAAVSGYEWAAAPAGWDTVVSAELKPFLPPAGDWQTSQQYTDEVLTTKYSGTAYLEKATGTVFVQALGG